MIWFFCLFLKAVCVLNSRPVRFSHRPNCKSVRYVQVQSPKATDPN